MKEIKKKDEVERFLKQFLPKLDIWGIIYIDREKNDAGIRKGCLRQRNIHQDNSWPAQQQDYLYLVPRVRVQNRLCIQKTKKEVNDGTICRHEESIYGWTCNVMEYLSLKKLKQQGKNMA